MVTEIRHKRGDTLEIEQIVWWDEGETVPADLTGWAPACEIRHTTGQKFPVTVSVVDALAGKINLAQTAANTMGWPLGDYAFDVEFTDGAGAVRSTQSTRLLLEEDVTNAP